MKINNEQLVELLVQHTGRKEEVVEEELSELINKIRSTAEEGESFEIERFGTFSMEEDELHFEPSEELYTEVNNKYAGMEPIELIGTYKDSETGKEQPDDHQTTETDEERAQGTTWPEEEDIWGWEETESHLEETGEASKEMEESPPEEEPGEEQIAETADQTEAQEKTDQDEEQPAEVVEQTEDQEQEEEDAPEETEEEPSAEPVSEEEEPDVEVPVEEEVDVEPEPESEPEPEPETETETEPEPVLAAEDATDTEEQQIEEEEEEKESQPAFSTSSKAPAGLMKAGRRRGNQKSTHNSMYTILVAVAMIIIIAIGSWFVFDLGVFTESGTGSDSGQSQQAAISTPSNQTQGNASGNISEEESSGQTRQGDQSPADGQNQQPATPDSSKTQENSEPERQNQVAQKQGEKSASSSSVYGLKGELNSNANDGYTIVVYSMQNQQHAKELYNGLKQKGFRTLMVSAIIDSTRYWRVAIGQFPSIDEAESTARELPDPYGTNFFIKRIR